MTTQNRYAKLSLAQMKTMRAELDTEIESRQTSERQKLKVQLQEMAAAAGLTLTDILGGGRITRRSPKRTVAAQYRNPADPTQTWTGRGRMPLWLAAAIKKGKKKEAFKI